MNKGVELSTYGTPVKDVYISSRGTHLRATGHHLTYGIAQCYLPPDTRERAPP